MLNLTTYFRVKNTNILILKVQEGYYNSVHRFSTPIKTDEIKLNHTIGEGYMPYFWCHNYNYSYSSAMVQLTFFVPHLRSLSKTDLGEVELANRRTCPDLLLVPQYNSSYSKCHRHNWHFSWPHSWSPVKTDLGESWTNPSEMCPDLLLVTITIPVIASATAQLTFSWPHSWSPVKTDLGQSKLSQSEMCRQLLFVHLIQHPNIICTGQAAWSGYRPYTNMETHCPSWKCLAHYALNVRLAHTLWTERANRSPY